MEDTYSPADTVSSELSSPLYQREIELEQEMIDRGYNRFMNQVSTARSGDNESTTSYGSILLKGAVEPLALSIQAFVEKAYDGSAGRRHTAAVLLKDVDPYVASFLTMRKLIDCLSSTGKRLFQSIAVSVGREIEFEVKLMKLAEKDSDRFEMTTRHLRGTHSGLHKGRVFTYAYGKYKEELTKKGKVDPDEIVGFTVEECLHLGTKLIELAITATGLFDMDEVAHKSEKNKMYYMSYTLHPTTECSAYIEGNIEKMSLISPDFLPTVIPPKDWTKASGGGYYNKDLPKLNLIKTGNRKYLEYLNTQIEKGELDTILTSVNALQRTGWKINNRVLEVANHLWWNTRGGVADLPLHDDEHLPLCPVCGADITDSANAMQKHDCLTELAKSDPDAFKAWKKLAGQVRKRNATNFGRKLGVSRILSSAERYKDEEVFYFPYQLDFRGRIYAVPAFLNPQGTQVAKGVLHFAKGKKLGSMEAVRWLAIHGSNVYGNDKVSLDDRHSWVLQHQQEILNVAKDPYEFKWWMDSDKPFCFLAFCFEWAEYCEKGLDFESRLPIAMDGTCNGLQLFSLMLRDEVGGHAVNLTPEDTPQDIYRIVADKVIPLVQADAVGEYEEVYSKTSGKLLYERRTVANLIMQMGITRKTTKRQVMVLPYGGTMQSCTEYTKKWITDKVNEGFAWPEGVSMHGAACYLSKYIWEAIGTTVIAARDAMAFLQGIAGVICKADGPVRWTTPCGLPVLQGYKSTKSRRVKTKMGESFTYFQLRKETDNYDLNKQKNAMSPNFVHSLDASALMKTVCRALGDGVDSYAMIHDSYGTHAASTATLARTLRGVFVDMFSENLLEKLLFEVKASLPMEEHKKLPVLPPVGKLDISKVMESKFFFA